MKIPVNVSSRSASVKVAIIGFLTLVMLIPLGMIRGIIFDRQSIESVAILDIRKSWGGDQTVIGPILKLPYKVAKNTTRGSIYFEEKTIHLLAEELHFTANVATEVRYRGIHKVPVFGADIGVSGRFDLGALETLGIATEHVVWSNAEVLLSVTDPNAVRKIPFVVVDGTNTNFSTSSHEFAGFTTHLSAVVGQSLGTARQSSSLEFEVSVALNGSGALQFVPLAANATVEMSADWGSPSFTGRQLPASREIRDNEFDASWHATSFGRELPAIWINTHAAQFNMGANAFGARFIQPVGLYQLIERATKYAVLFIGLTFVTYFLMEVVSNLRLHPLQYLLVGLANTLFYMLLLSLAEHLAFDLAYAISALASAALISGYSAAILVRRTRAFLMAVVLAVLYAFLYLTLQAETFALLAGSIGLWIVLAMLMYLTRRINWYAAGDSDQKQATAD